MTRRQWLMAMASPMALPFGAESFADASGGVHAMELTLPSRLLTRKELEADVVVVGGGMAGVCAAIAAARNGASVVLIQDRPVLGGNSSSEIRMHIVGADCSGGRKDTDARETGILEELRLECAVRNPQRSASMWDLLLYEWVRRETNITLLLNTSCVGVQMASENSIGAVIALRNSTEDLFTVRGKIFIDCSGNGRLGAEAGADFRIGREGRDEFGESLAPPEPDNKTMGSSILFITRKYDRPMPFKPPDWIRKFPRCEDLPYRHHRTWEYGYWWVEWGGHLNIVKENERIRDELLAIALGVWDHIKNSGLHPESENWALEWIGFVPCTRGSRRFLGDYILTQHDLQRGEIFEDGVAFGGWPIDLHPPEGIDTKEPPNIAVGVPLYNIPFRCLYSRNITNLLFAGRNISATHVAYASTRVMGTCSVMGQAVGTAAALCVRYNCTPRELGKEAIKELQQLLLKQDAYIIGVTNSDPYDIARTAEVRASSEVRGWEAVNVINGVHRGVYERKNRWASDPTQPMPQWLELHFREPKRIREVHLTFDTGLNRALTLTHEDGFHRRMVWGPQPETVRDYELQVLYGDSAKTVVKVEGNYQRKRVHQFEPQLATGIRLIVHATNGDKSARVFEVRVYE
ncbi:hypothetical protein M2350_000484 [Candidatus Fervidibacter sacchari]|uniref:FAD-dependent oxidoreductase n=2 Tax=Candidatus Fervidibacter sacchari TaxID=1448929 RepID=A0ABT2EJI2_9BACT|nr:hypothetical protein [Candidatus Fervidibacter sacchari]